MSTPPISDAPLGVYIYMAMGRVGLHRCCMAVAYKLDYAVKKALQFERASAAAVIFDKINKVKVGNLEPKTSFSRSELAEYVNKF